MSVLNTIRLVLFILTLCGSLIIVGTDAHNVHEWQLLRNAYPDIHFHAYPALNLVMACLTFLIVGTSLIIDRLRPRAITSLVIVELAWVGLLWPVWLYTAGWNVRTQPWWGYHKIVRAFSFVNWLSLFAWWDILLAFSIHAASNGVRGVWCTPVREHLEHSVNAASPHGRSPTTTYPTVPAFNYGGPVTGQFQPGYGMPPAPQQPFWPQQAYYGMPPPHQPYGAPQPQQGYGPPAPQQGYGTSQPQQAYSVPAPGSPPNASQG